MPVVSLSAEKVSLAEAFVITGGRLCSHMHQLVIPKDECRKVGERMFWELKVSNDSVSNLLNGRRRGSKKALRVSWTI